MKRCALPIIFVDPTGMFFESIFVWLAELAATGAAVAPEVVVTAEATTEMPQNYAYDPLTGSGFDIPVDPILTPALPQSGAIEPLMIQPTDFISIPKLEAKAVGSGIKAVGSSIWSKIASGAMVTTGAIASKFGVKSS